jgi:hypothetical protein
LGFRVCMRTPLTNTVPKGRLRISQDVSPRRSHADASAPEVRFS